MVRFSEKDSHQVFLEPEGWGTHEVYCNGISTSLPRDVQDSLIRGMRGLEQAFNLAAAATGPEEEEWSPSAEPAAPAEEEEKGE